MNFGVPRTVPHFIGVWLGFTIFLLVIGLGLGAVFLQYPELHHVIKIAGSIYMLYLSWKIATSHTKVQGKKMAEPVSFIEAALFQWVNPKCWVMGVSAMSTYTSVTSAHAYLEVFIITLTYCIVFIPCGGLWIFGGVKLKNLFKNDRYQAWFNYTMGGLLALSVIPMLF
jgi:threonine/homoserine/homoserine lactone efflux protein